MCKQVRAGTSYVLLHRPDEFAGEIVALMGPSGSGKTTLLNTLARRQDTSATGNIGINGSERPLAVHRDISAFVEQEDTLIGSLTVHETLKFAARLSLPRTVSSDQLHHRVNHLIDAFGLKNQSQTLIGTPLQKGLSGGQKRRVSVATQLITSPKVLFLDEPTSGLDSTASFEVISFLRDFARRNNILMIASIHQPSTKTFDLFDKICLLSQGKACFFGTSTEMATFLNSVDLAIPQMMNPAEHILDITNVDFSTRSGDEQSRLDVITSAWQRSPENLSLQRAIQGGQTSSELPPSAGQKPSAMRQISTLLHRSLVKGYRDLTVYWIRIAMYLGLAIMMGTVWLRLSTDQANIQPFVNAIVSEPGQFQLEFSAHDTDHFSKSSSDQLSCHSWLSHMCLHSSRTVQRLSKSELTAYTVRLRSWHPTSSSGCRFCFSSASSSRWFHTG